MMNSKSEIYNMARVAVKLEDKFVDLAYKMGEIEGLDASEVKTYIRYITDRRLSTTWSEDKLQGERESSALVGMGIERCRPHKLL
jgi:ribonucleotide reductase beta subunit family protein with ferritin-like domain